MANGPRNIKVANLIGETLGHAEWLDGHAVIATPQGRVFQFWPPDQWMVKSAFHKQASEVRAVIGQPLVRACEEAWSASGDVKCTLATAAGELSFGWRQSRLGKRQNLQLVEHKHPLEWAAHGGFTALSIYLLDRAGPTHSAASVASLAQIADSKGFDDTGSAIRAHAARALATHLAGDATAFRMRSH